MDIIEIIRDKTGISEEIIEGMQGKLHMKMEDKTLVSMKKAILTTVDTKIMEVGMMGMTSPTGIIVMIGVEVKMETDMQIQLMDPQMDY